MTLVVILFDGERVFYGDVERVYLGTAKSSMVFERS